MIALSANTLTPARRLDTARRTVPSTLTVSQRWRLKRNIAIYLAHKGGLSIRNLADVHNLPRSSISEILKEMRANEAA